MSGPQHQHFIPRSYIKNFAIKHGGTYLVEAKLKSDYSPKNKLIGIKDICVNKNLYTIPNSNDDDKYALEKFYATNVDSVYPEVYNLLVDPSVKEITAEQRVKIIYTTLSLYFRTPHFLRANEKEADKAIDLAILNHKDGTEIIKLTVDENSFEFRYNEIEIFRSKLKKQLKLNFLKNHLGDWQRFVEHKVRAGIYVLKINGDIALISSDNPISINKPFYALEDIFDPGNMISFAIDHKHYVQIMPNDIESVNQIFRGERDSLFAIGQNHSTEESSEEWIYGIPGSITRHIKDQSKYEEINEDNIKILDEMKEITCDMIELVELIEKYGRADSRVIQLAKQLSNKEIHKEDKKLKDIANGDI